MYGVGKQTDTVYVIYNVNAMLCKLYWAAPNNFVQLIIVISVWVFVYSYCIWLFHSPKNKRWPIRVCTNHEQVHKYEQGDSSWTRQPYRQHQNNKQYTQKRKQAMWNQLKIVMSFLVYIMRNSHCCHHGFIFEVQPLIYLVVNDSIIQITELLILFNSNNAR